MGLCDYGCGQEAHFQLKSGKWCCSPCFNKCPAVRIKNSFGKKQEGKIKCTFCGREVSCSNIRSHENVCQFNPNNNHKVTIKENGWHERVYNNIIMKRRKEIPEGYTESHHIIPKSLGGSNSKTNIIRLTAREHFICHALLVHIFEYDKFKYTKMLDAFLLMKGDKYRGRYLNSRLYEYARKRFSELCKIERIGENNPQFNKRSIYNPTTNVEKVVMLDEIEKYKKEGYIKGTKKSYYRKIKKEEKAKNWRETLESNRINNIKFLEKAMPYYEQNGWEKTKKKFNIKFSQQNFVMKCKQYMKEFKPTMGKPRGKKNSKLLVPDMH